MGLELGAQLELDQSKPEFGLTSSPSNQSSGLEPGGANQEDKESLALHAGSCSSKLLNELRPGSPHLHLFRTFEWNTLIHPITVSRWGVLSVERP